MFAEIRHIALNAFWLVIEKFLRAGLGLFVFAMVARHLGPDHFGLISFAMALVFFFSPFTTLGFTSLLRRDFSLGTFREHKALLSMAFSTRLILSSLFYVLISLYALLFISSPWEKYSLLLVAGGLIFQSFETLEVYYESQLKSKIIFKYKTLSFLFMSLLRLLFVYLDLNIFFFAFLFPLDFAFAGIGLYSHLEERDLYHFDLRMCQRYLKESWPLLLSGISIGIYMKIDQMMIRGMLDSTSVGLYSVSMRMTELFYFISIALSRSAFSKIMEKKDHLLAFKEAVKNLLRAQTALAFIFGCFLFFFAHDLIALIFQRSFADSFPILRVHAWSILFVFWGVTQEVWDVRFKLFHFSLFRTVSGAFLNIVLNYFFIQSWGAIGAAWATVLSQAYVCSISNLLLKRGREYFYLQLRSLMLFF